MASADLESDALLSDRSVETSGGASTGLSSINSTPNDLEAYLKKNPSATCVIGINGKWYDVTHFRKRHPGGSVLLDKCAGQDATAQFNALHERNVLAGWRPVGSYEMTGAGEDTERIRRIFEDLGAWFRKEGFFETSYLWYASKVLFTFSLLIASLLVLYWARESGRGGWVYVLAGLLFGNYWQQCGFFMHDFMHNELTHSRRWDQLAGLFFGSVCFGVSAHWWRDEHFEHHAFTNGYDAGSLYVDPQMQEDVWVQHPFLFTFAFNNSTPVLRHLIAFIVPFQHLLAIPMAVFAGRIAILVNALFIERRWFEWVAHGLHVAYMWVLLTNCIPTWKYRLMFYFTAAFYEGILHIQLISNHIFKPWTSLDSLFNEVGWHRVQVLANTNIANPRWLDWFYGGLNFHIEHHLYPTMPRHRFREASKYVKEACEKAGLFYDSCPLSEIFIRQYNHMRNLACMYTANRNNLHELLKKARDPPYVVPTLSNLPRKRVSSSASNSEELPTPSTAFSTGSIPNSPVEGTQEEKPKDF